MARGDRVTLTCPVCRRAFERYRCRITTAAPACSIACDAKRRAMPRAAIVAAQQKANERIQGQIRFYFGRLSERELAIWRHAWHIAHQRGMKRRRADQRRQVAA